ncbi:PilT protein domain protein [Thermofilum adornatum 1505]|uniref:PilT protein domain protein n=1 Tax=Thermofilum adornatum 1505 TaxID=697581 RepID=A0A3G1A530_9CREN|nr:type II toxin-antitoxin system VapC family toxin [Thermofilum adornatum]AJB41872.1 PilT protein domain protein [Thermofilum adornatum 1505]
MRVIDSSALVKYFSREPGWERVEQVMLEGVLTLDLSAKEIANALWKKVTRNEMSYEVAMEIVRDIVENKALRMESQESYLMDAFKIAVEAKVTVYDALFVALAKKKGLELVTCDAMQAEVAKSMNVKVLLL